MIDTRCQVRLPALSAHAWLIDLCAAGGPQFAVLRPDSTEARKALVNHLTEIGTFADLAEAEETVANASASSIGVVW